MKRMYLTITLCVCANILFAQSLKRSYFGIKAGANISTNELDPTMTGFETENKTAFAGGIYYNIGIGKMFSIQPEVLYSAMGSRMKQTTTPVGEGDFNLEYVSIPLLLKVSPVWRLGIFVGPQFDILVNGKFEETDVKEKLTDYDFAGTAGLEFWVTKNIGLYGRYIWGFENINEGKPVVNPLTTTITSEMFNRGWQVGLNIGFRGKAKPKDGDGDGVVDPDDKCPAEVGTAKYNGCPVPDTDSDGINDENDQCISQAGTAKYNGCPVPDTDGDGVNDDNDQCINQSGLAKYNGCPVPDTDSDGLNDENDKCPNEPGSTKYAGCPIPDTDGDGINDEIDKCPNQPGKTIYDGCPAADTDGDGVNDEEDKCPNKPGVPEMKGCPKIEYRAHAVTFGSSKATLTNAGKSELDRLFNFLQDNPDVKINLIGYTDATGTDKVNDPLSLKRAESSKKYLVNKGIKANRISVEGRGSTNPIGDNTTKEGKAQNRRIELEVQ